jgi:tetratricopeptide (TPR) repeat protein
VIHRDVKPANLLLDGRGKLWVTDFGLALCKSQAGLTLTGDLIGTLRYMSPEQALARRVGIDQRTDVYSLGATLYELLTQQPVFAGADKQELLRQIAFEEPRRPRRLNRAIPAELEVIVLKALEKNPADRYATAQELADDLRRFQQDEPIRAQPTGVARRLRKWGRRHPAWVAAVAAALTAALAVLAGGIGWVVGDRSARQAEAEGRVAEALAVAEAKLPLGNPYDPELITAARKAEAQLAGGAVGDELRQRVERVLADLVMLEKLEAIRLDEAMGKDGPFDYAGANIAYALAFRAYGIDVEALEVSEAAARIRRRAIRLHLAAALDNWAFVKVKLQAGSEAPLRVLAQLADGDPWRQRLRDPQVLTDRAALERLAGAEGVLDQPPANLVLLGRYLAKVKGLTIGGALLRKAQQRHPADFWINFELASHFLHDESPGATAERLSFFRVALALRPQSSAAQNNLGVALFAQRKFADAEEAFRKAIALRPRDALTYHNLGNALLYQGKAAAAVDAYRHAIQIKPDDAAARTNLANALHDLGRQDEAIKEFREAIALGLEGGHLHFHFANNLQYIGRLDEAIKEYRTAIDRDPPHSAHHSNLGMALLKLKRPDEAIAEFQKALALDPKSAHAHYSLGEARAAKGQWSEAAAAYGDALRVAPNNPTAMNHLAWIWANCPETKLRNVPEAIRLAQKVTQLDPKEGAFWNTLGVARYRAGEWQESVAAFEQSMRLHRGGDGYDWFVLAMAHWQLGHKDEAGAYFRKAVRWMDKHQPNDEEFRRYRAEAAALLGITDNPRATGKDKPAPKP